MADEGRLGVADLRPIERRVLKLEEAGVPRSEIARRFKRSPDHIAKIVDYARLPDRSARRRATALRPLERRVLHLRGEGLDHGEIGRRFRRSPDHMRRVEGFALYKMARELLSP
jgi:DNA-binding CsgD family transcriptional regulator